MKSSLSDLFAGLSLRARIKLVVLDPTRAGLAGEASGNSSLNHIEHVSPARLLRSEISPPAFAQTAANNAAVFALLRKWFWSRKPDAGFVLWGLPATLLQAMVFDEWLEARQECLDAVIPGAAGKESPALVDYYRNQGLLMEADGHTIIP
ncbi:MAG: adenylate kinase [Opitutaceae bacterium]|nr:adenylate kinase [Opitutaceae bacterium]